MANFFTSVFSSISVLLTSEPVFYIISIMGLALILYVFLILINED